MAQPYILALSSLEKARRNPKNIFLSWAISLAIAHPIADRAGMWEIVKESPSYFTSDLKNISKKKKKELLLF